jgi:hypothetical protein
VGGGLAAGLAILGGGYYAYHEQEKKKTEGEVSSSFPNHILSFF